jgi:hypothetical protein
VQCALLALLDGSMAAAGAAGGSLVLNVVLRVLASASHYQCRGFIRTFHGGWVDGWVGTLRYASKYSMILVVVIRSLRKITIMRSLNSACGYIGLRPSTRKSGRRLTRSCRVRVDNDQLMTVWCLAATSAPRGWRGDECNPMESQT